MSGLVTETVRLESGAALTESTMVPPRGKPEDFPSERYDSCKVEIHDLPAAKTLLDVSERTMFRRKREAIAGYDITEMGAAIAQSILCLGLPRGHNIDAARVWRRSDAVGAPGPWCRVRVSGQRRHLGSPGVHGLVRPARACHVGSMCDLDFLVVCTPENQDSRKRTLTERERRRGITGSSLTLWQVLQKKLRRPRSPCTSRDTLPPQEGQKLLP